MIPIQRVPRLWSSSTWFVVACTAAVVSLSNFWRLPYLLTQYGGGAFLLVYVGALIAMGLPLFSGQLLMARGTGADMPGVIATWTRPARHSRLWVWSAYLGVLGAALLLAAYSVVASWSLAYGLRGVTGGLDTQSIGAARGHFVAFVRDSERGFGWLILFFCVLVATASRGLQRGIEPIMRTLAVCMLFGFVILLVSAVMDARASEVLQELFMPKFSSLHWQGALEALYQAFFTLSLGTGVIVAFGSYLPDRAPVVRLSLAVIALALVVALGCAFMLKVFAAQGGVALSGGLQSLFEVLPVALGQSWRTPIIYVLVGLVSVSTAIGLFEPVVQLYERRSGYSRLRSSLHCSVGIGLLGLAALLSFGPLAGWSVLGYGLFGWIILVATHAIVPFTGLLLCVLLGRVLGRRRLVVAWHGEPVADPAWGFMLWHAVLRYPTRIALIIVLAYSLGVLALIRLIWLS